MIAIKGIEMPKGAKDCVLGANENFIVSRRSMYCMHTGKKCFLNKRPTWCPLVEIKEVAE